MVEFNFETVLKTRKNPFNGDEGVSLNLKILLKNQEKRNDDDIIDTYQFNNDITSINNELWSYESSVYLGEWYFTDDPKNDEDEVVYIGPVDKLSNKYRWLLEVASKKMPLLKEAETNANMKKYISTKVKKVKPVIPTKPMDRSIPSEYLFQYHVDNFSELAEMFGFRVEKSEGFEPPSMKEKSPMADKPFENNIYHLGIIFGAQYEQASIDFEERFGPYLEVFSDRFKSLQERIFTEEQ